MTRRVAAAILAVDEFTGIPITGSQVRVRSRDGAVPVCKEDGYRIFWDNGEKERHFLVEAPGFYPEAVSVNLPELQRKSLPAESVYLIPGINYPFPGGMAWREENGQPAEALVFPWKGSEQIITFYGCENGTVTLGVPHGLHMRDRLLYLINRRTQKTELCAIMEESARKGVYSVKAPLKEKWNREETAVCLAYRAMADDRGKCFLPDIAAAARFSSDRRVPPGI